MGNRWVPCTLEEILEVKHGWAFKGEYMSEDAESGPVVVAIGNFDYSGGFRFESTKIKRYINEFPEEYVLAPGSILLAMTCQTAGGEILGIPGRIPTAGTYLHNQRLGKIIVTAEDKVLEDYLYWLFLSKPFNQHLYQTATGTKILHTSPSKITSYRFDLPPKCEQEQIAQVLWSLDNKINLNRQMNSTLEAMAQALFKSWFVDFDPVIDNALAVGNPIPDELAARAERRKQLHAHKGASSSEHLTPAQPLPAAIQPQFPDRFVFTEALGWVPEGWEVSTIGEHVENTGGGTPSTKNEAFWQGGSHAFCTPKDMSRLTSWMLTDTERHLTDAGVKKVSSGLLPKRSVLMSSRAPIGYLAISNIPVSVNQGIIAMLPNASFGPLYLLSWAKFNMSNIIDRANGSTFLEISKRNFQPLPFLVPNSSICQAFNKEAEAILERILLLSEQNISLTNLRDTLLPKLLSGQLRIPEAEQQVAEIV